MIVSEDDCVAMGGHCYHSTGDVIAGDPPSYVEQCIHCDKKRIGTPQPDMVYRDA